MGTTFPGKHVVAYNYCLEIIPKTYQQTLVNVIGFCETGVIIVIALFYLFISKSWKPLQMIGVVETAVALLFGCLFLFESPKFLYNHGRFEESRQSLRNIAWLNGLPQAEINDRFNFVFDTEAAAGEMEARDEEQMLAMARQVTEQANNQMSDS